MFNHGKHKRSFTYVDDIVEGVIRSLDRPPGTDPAWRGDAPDPASSGVAPYRIYNIPSTGLRFFTVYGPWGRPDMALFLFTKAILDGKPIRVFNHGKHKRSFTYVDDIVEGVVRALDRVPGKDPEWNSAKPDPATSGVAPYRLYNIGNEQPVELLRYIEVLEQCLGRKAQMDLLPLQPGDVPDTEADVSDLITATGYRPQVGVEQGVANFVDWYRSYYRA